jgi:SAM-dependent methyltransferase
MANERLRPDFGATAGDYAQHRAGFPDSLFDRLAAFEVGLPRQIVVDLGTGTGTLARGFARRGCQVIGIDIAEQMLEQARLRDAKEGLKVDYRVAGAEATGLSNGSVDVVAAGQCWHWFDRPRAAREVLRILRPTGRVVIAHLDFIPLTGNVVQATEALIEKYNPAWKFGGGLGIHPQWLRDLGEAGFSDLQTFSYDVSVPYTHESWRGRIRASAGVGASLADAQVREFDVDLARLLARDYPAEAFEIPHRVFAVVARAPASADHLGDGNTA